MEQEAEEIFEQSNTRSHNHRHVLYKSNRAGPSIQCEWMELEHCEQRLAKSITNLQKRYFFCNSNRSWKNYRIECSRWTVQYVQDSVMQVRIQKKDADTSTYVHMV